MSVCKVMVTKTVAREGICAGDVVAVKFALAGEYAKNFRDLWIGLYARGKGQTVIEEQFLPSEAGVMEIDTSGVLPGDYVFLLQEGDVWPLITTLASSQSFVVSVDEEPQRPPPHSSSTELEPPRPPPRSSSSSRGTSSSSAGHNSVATRSQRTTRTSVSPHGSVSPRSSSQTAAPSVRVTSTATSVSSSSSMSPRGSVSPRSSSQTAAPSSRVTSTATSISSSPRGSVSRSSTPAATLSSRVTTSPSTQMDREGVMEFRIGEYVEALCDMDGEWHRALVRGYSYEYYSLMFDEMDWEQALTPCENVRALQKKPSSPHSRESNSQPKMPPKAKSSGSLRRAVPRVVSSPSFVQDLDGAELSAEFWASMEEEATNIQQTRAGCSLDELSEEQRYLDEMEAELAQLSAGVPVASSPSGSQKRWTAAFAHSPGARASGTLSIGKKNSPTETGIGVAKAVRDFLALRSGQLTVRRNDVLKVISRPDKNWLMCARGRDCGLVPVNSVAFIPK